MKPQSVDNFILFNILERVKFQSYWFCKQWKGMLNCEIEQSWSQNMSPRKIHDDFIKTLEGE